MSAPRRLGALLATVALATAACSASGGSTGAESSKDATTTTAATSTSGGSTTTGGDGPGASTLRWTSCDDGFECATLRVPVDHAKPTGKTLTLGLARRPADDQAHKIGSLLMNPGGPGGSAIDLIEGIPLPKALTDKFDIVGFDPRGVGRSSALDCRSHLQEIYDADPTMEDQADRTEYLKVSKAFVDECQRKYADLLPHLGTRDVARDMDLVRAAVGDPKLTYVGYSYGTAIGQVYAQLFPTHVRAMVLDGVMDLSQDGLQGATGQAKGFDGALQAFLADCDRRDCLGDPAGEVLDEVTAQSEKRPIPAKGADRPATPGVVNLAVGEALYSESLWPALAKALTDARDGDGTGLVDLADEYLQRDPDGSYESGFEIYFAVSCLDQAFPRDPTKVFAAAKAAGKLYPRVGEGLVNDYVRCALWPTPAQPVGPVPATTKGLPPTVVISTTNDPATPYQSGVRAAEQIPGAVLITNKGEGHTIFAQGKRCVDDAVTTYLVDVKPPKDGLTC